MDSTTSVSAVMIGMPDTGKTTFLAALWYAVATTGAQHSGMRLSKLRGDTSYLDRIQSNWLRYEMVERTKLSSEGSAELDLFDTNQTESITFHIPDLSGERFRHQLESRVVDLNYAELVRDAAGAMLFVHAGGIKDTTSIDDANEIASVFSEDNPSPGEEADDLVGWDAQLVSTQVAAVDLLQILLTLRADRQPMALSVVISAWDLVIDYGRPPDQFLAERVPLLSQFLQANDDRFLSTVFGVSAQGGRLNTQEDSDRLARNILNTEDRVVVQHGSNQSHDITLPIQWLADAGCENSGP